MLSKKKYSLAQFRMKFNSNATSLTYMLNYIKINVTFFKKTINESVWKTINIMKHVQVGGFKKNYAIKNSVKYSKTIWQYWAIMS